MGLSLQYKRPVADVIGRRIANSLTLAMLAFLVAIPLGVLLGLLAGLNGGKTIDRILTLGGLVTAATPDFAAGIFLVMIFAMWLKILPGATVYTDAGSVLSKPNMLILPVLTASLVEVGYILRITRASVLEVMSAAYVRTAILKGMPRRKMVFGHVLRNSLMAPVTVIMLHVNWLIGGLVVVEAVFRLSGAGQLHPECRALQGCVCHRGRRDGAGGAGRRFAADCRHHLLVPEPADPVLVACRYRNCAR